MKLVTSIMRNSYKLFCLYHWLTMMWIHHRHNYQISWRFQWQRNLLTRRATVDYLILKHRPSKTLSVNVNFHVLLIWLCDRGSIKKQLVTLPNFLTVSSNRPCINACRVTTVTRKQTSSFTRNEMWLKF